MRMPQAVRHQLGRQLQRLPVGGKTLLDLTGPQPPAPLGQPQRRMTGKAAARPDVDHVVLDRLHRPRHHGADRPPLRRRPMGRLTPPDLQLPELPQLRRLRIAVPVGDIQLRRLSAPKPPPIHHLEHRGIPVGGQRPLAAQPDRLVDPVIGVIEEPLQFLAGHRPPVRVAFVIHQMRGGVRLEADLHRMRAEPGLALLSPPVLRRDQVALERPDRVMMIADRGLRLARDAGQISGPVIQMGSRPVPRVLPGMLQEPAYHRPPLLHGARRKPATAELLLGPPRQHRLQHRVLLAQQRDPADQLQPGRTRGLTDPSSHRSPHPRHRRKTRESCTRRQN